MDQNLNVLFIGQRGKYSLSPLRAIMERYNVVGIVESAIPGKRRKEKPCIRSNTSDLATLASSKSIPYMVHTSKTSIELENFVRHLQPDIICIASMSQLLKPEVFTIPKYGAINFHPSLLPKYRGQSTWFWHYYNMDAEGGATIHFIDEGMDTGDIIEQESFKIPLGMPRTEFVDEATKVGARLMCDALEKIANGTAKRHPQKHLSCPRIARKLRSNEYLIDWKRWTIERIYHILRGGFFLYESLPSSYWVRSNFKVTVESFKKYPSTQISGKVRIDMKGFYFSHTEGKIRIRIRPLSKKGLLLALGTIIHHPREIFSALRFTPQLNDGGYK